jgi:L-fucose dehydrogenase
MKLDLTGKIIAVSGGAKGIGAAICTELIDEGAVPVILDMDKLATQQFLSQYKESQAGSFITDLAIPENCRQAVDYIDTQYGRLDGLVNNAGVNDCVGLISGTPSEFMESVKRNLLHVFSLTHYSLPLLKESKGPIVNISSKTAVTGQGNTSGYVASKGGILGITREWAVELLSSQIRVNTVVPAEVYTPLYDQWLKQFSDPEKKKREIEKRIPLGKRMTTAQEIASTVIFLLSSKSSHTTGQIIFVDGGYTHLDRAIT